MILGHLVIGIVTAIAMVLALNYIAGVTSIVWLGLAYVVTGSSVFLLTAVFAAFRREEEPE